MSKPGSGTSVKLYLPQAGAGVEMTATEDEPAAAIGELSSTGLCVLVVEDNPRVRRVTVRRLVDLGFVVLEAEDASQALDILDAGESVDLLLTDVLMPGGMTGGELAREAQHRQPDIGILFASGYTSEAAVSKGLLDQSARLLAKPYSRDELIRGIRGALKDRTRNVVSIRSRRRDAPEQH